MILLSAEKIKKNYSEKKLLHEVTLYLNERDKVGVIGINGTGKSTLLKIIAGIEQPDSGVISKTAGITIGYLPQNPDFCAGTTVLKQVLSGTISQGKDLQEFEAKAVLTRLGITDFSKDVGLLSGGEKKRVALASALIKPFEVLILDEPTNHLDNEMVQWLENYLIKYPGAILMVTHDRYFLDRVANRIVEVQRGNLYNYQANYSKYLEQKTLREEMAHSTERKNESLFRKELEWIQQGARARSTKSKERIERFEKLRDREKPLAENKIQITSMASRLGKKTAHLQNVSKSFGGKILIRDFNYIILRNARIGIVGKNGCGKSTLLKLITGDIKPDSGTVDIGDTVKAGYFSQESDELDTSVRVIDFIRSIAEHIVTKGGTLSASQMLERFLFPADLQYSRIEKLSGGERRRLLLLKVLMAAPNILLLDEPSNDLDVETLTILENYLEGFAGAVVAVSHDRYFLDKVVNRIIEFKEDGRLQEYAGGYSDFAAFLAVQSQQEKQTVEKNHGTAEKKNNNQEPRQTKLKFTYKEQKEYGEIEDVIACLEIELRELEVTMHKEAANYVLLNELMAEKVKLGKKLEDKVERWVYLQDLAERIASQK